MTEVHNLAFVDTPQSPGDRRPLAAVPHRSVVLTDDPELAGLVPGGDTEVAVWGTDLAPANVPDTVADLGFRPAHLRALLRLDRGAEPTAARALHDLTFAALQGLHARLESVVVLVVGGVVDGPDGVVPRPETGLFAGLLRSAARELPDAWCATVLAGDLPAGDALSLMAAESTRRQGWWTVAYSGGRRWELAMRAQEPSRPPALPALGDDAVVVAVGGGRGITTHCLRALIRPGRGPHVYLLGRTAPPAGPTAPPPPLADFLRERRVTRGQARTADLVAEHRALVRAAELRATLDRLRDRAR
uniref:hypothetical protein n=1 Tax=Nocardiopsis gilva TaxID=280236 RepID=UPI0004757A67